MAFDFSFIPALDSLGPDAAFTISREAKPPARYLLATILPEMNKPTFHVEAGEMTVRALMAGLVGMDSAYPETGHVSVSKFLEQSAKVANKATLSEKALREILAIVMQLQLSGGSAVDQLAQDVLNFLDKVILQGHFDRTEWLRAQALVYGEIDWTFSGITLAVDYGVPAGNFTTPRSGNDAYNGSTSKFWVDMRAQSTILRRSVRARILNSTTLEAIVSNSVNALEILSESAGRVRVRKYLTIGGNTVPSSDARDTMEFIVYDEEGEIPDLASPGETIRVPFIPDGKILAIGNNTASTFRPGQGSTDDPAEMRAIGYTHIAPTIEGRGMMGRWSRVYTPQERPYQLAGEAVANLLPVIEAPKKIAVSTTAFS